MQKLSKRIISLIITLAILITILPSSIMAKELKENSQKTTSTKLLKITESEINPEYIYYLDHPEEFKYGYIPQKYLLPFDKSSEVQFRSSSENLPSKFTTDLEYVTPVKNQFKTGTCWAHSALSTVETLILRQTNTTKEDLNLSEGHMALNSSRAFNLHSGGNNYVALRYFSTLAGPVSEKNFPKYTITSDFTGSGLNAMADSKSKQHEYYIAEAKEYENTTENIKRAVYNNYSATSGYFHDEDNKGMDKNDSKKYHFIKKEEVTIKKGDKEEKELVPITNHQVTIVGWDDDIEIENQNGEKATGAFLVKNSWGTDKEDNKDNKDQIDKGYYWISYNSFPSENNNLLVFTKVEKRIENVKNVYTYPDANVPNMIGCMKFNNSPVSIINVFNRGDQEPEEITKVNLYNLNPNGMSYTLYISQDGDLDDSNKTIDFKVGKETLTKPLYETKGNWEKISEGHINDRGYATIDLAKAYKLDKNSFALKLDIASSDNVTYVNYSPVENYPPVKVYNDFGYKNSYISYGDINSAGLFLKINDDEHSEHNYLNLNAITRTVSQPSLTIEEPEKAWEATEGYELEKFEPLVIKVVNDGNVRLSHMGFDLLGDDKDKFEIVNKDKDLYLPSLDKGKGLEVKIKPKEVLTLENADKVFKLTLSVEAKEIEKPVTKDFTFKLKLDQKAREEAIEKAKVDAREKISTLKYLLEDQRSYINRKIDEIKKPGDIDSIVKDAEALNLTNAKSKIADEIENLKELDPEEKNGFKNRLKDVVDIAEVENIKQEAKNKNDEKEKARLEREKEELEAEKNKLEEAIKKAENLIKDDAISDTAKDLKIEIYSASSILKDSTKISKVKEAIESLESKTKAQEDFVKAKETLKADIKQLDDLSKEEKDGFLTQINEAKNQADIETIKKSAEDTNKNNKEAKQELEKAKSEAIEEIKAMKYLGNKKDDFIGKVEAAKDKDSLAQVLADAEKLNKENEAIALEKAKEKEAEEAVNNLVTSGENASLEDIEEAQKLIDKLKDGSKKLELQDKLNDVAKLTELKAAKEKAIEAIKGLSKIEGEKQSLIDRVNKASKVEDVNSIFEEAKNLSKERMTEEEKLNNARGVAITSINATNMPDLTNEEREGFENKIKSAETIDAVNAIVKNAQNKNNENHRVKAELAEKRTQAKATINGLPNIEKEKDGFISEIETAKDLASVESVVQRAKEKSSENTAKIKALEDAKIEAKGKISSGNMPDLTDEDRQGFEKEIKEATSIDLVNQVVERAKDKNKDNKNAKDALNKAKADAVAEIEKMEFLDSTEKADFKKQVNLATDTSKVVDIQKAADARNADKKAEKEENDKIEKAKTALENLERNGNPSASEIQNVQSLIDQLKNGETKENLQKRLDPIKAANELKLLKDDAIREIKNLTNIEDLKEAFIQEINESEDKNSVNEILNKAKEKSQEATKFIEEKNKTVEKIRGLENLNEEEKLEFLAELETVTSLDSLKNLCLKANKKDANKLLNSKSLEDLTENERKAAEKKLEEAETEEAIKTIIEEAKGQATINKEAAKSLADAKEAAIKLIGADKMPELSSEERKGLEDRIEKATSPEEVKKIQAEASSINSSREKEKNLYKTKDKAEKELENFNDLSVRDLQTFKDKISKAGSQEEVERILEEAKNQVLINKNNKIKEERERENRREESKTYFWFNSFPKHQAETEKVKVTPQAPSFKQKEKLETKKFVYKFVIGKTKFTENNDGLNQAKELDVAPFIENGRTMLPLRAIAESIGIKVDWENSTRTAIFTNGDLVARIQIDGNKVILSDGRLIVLDAKPKIVKGRIVLPITNVSQIFGLTNGNTNDGKKNDIEWDNETKSVIISVNK